MSVFLRLQTQWTISAGGTFVGLNYAGVEALLNILDTANRAEVFEGLQVMEAEALRVLNRRKG